MLLKINKSALAETISSIGVHPASIPIFSRKAEILPFKLFEVRTPAANIIKQEMLAAGGDAVTPIGSVVCATKYVDILLLGTVKHYNTLLKKLKQMPFFGISKIVEDLSLALSSLELETVLADGRKLTYEKIRLMGILNITPDSFYNASRVTKLSQIMQKAEDMLSEGADVLDMGGESTRPGSDSVDGEEERRRILPAINAVRKAYPTAILSVDTYRADTAAAALDLGADIINDISAMETDENMLNVVMKYKAPIILMHKRGIPSNMQQNCNYKNVVEEVAIYLYNRAQLLRKSGIGINKIILDPGIGFAKNVEQNLRLMRDLEVFTSFRYPVLLAASRKSTIGTVLGNIPAEERLEGTIATSLQAVYSGIQMVRVHDVKANLRAIRMLEAVLCQEKF